MKKKRIAIMAVCMGLGLGAVAGSYAWLTAESDAITNTFTSSEKITIDLNEEFDKDAAAKYLPGDVLTKKPTVKNTSATTNAYAGIKVEFQKTVNGVTTTITRADFEANYATHDAIPAGWDLIKTGANGEELYMYTTELAPNGSTPAIFTKVTVNGEIAVDAQGNLPKFDIVVTGYATQSKNVTPTMAQDSLIKLVGWN